MVSVNIVVPPVIIDFGPTIHTVIKGEAVQLKCQAAGTPMPTIKWQKNGMSFKSLHEVAEVNIFALLHPKVQAIFNFVLFMMWYNI